MKRILLNTKYWHICRMHLRCEDNFESHYVRKFSNKLGKKVTEICVMLYDYLWINIFISTNNLRMVERKWVVWEGGDIWTFERVEKIDNFLDKHYVSIRITSKYGDGVTIWTCKKFILRVLSDEHLGSPVFDRNGYQNCPSFSLQSRLCSL